MPKHKDVKRLIRARMQKTGESYTAARAQLLRTPPTTVAAMPPGIASYAAAGGMSDAAVEKATGRTWAQWVTVLDRVQAHSWPHPRIATYLSETYQVRSWWRQMVAVGYERIKGLRARGQRRDGGYEATRSKVFGVSVEKLYHAFASERLRARWLAGVSLEIRRATTSRSMRITWEDGTSVAVGFTAKGEAKSLVQLAHSKLLGKADADRRKVFWSERLEALAEMLQTSGQKR
jgi:hypothetical protein